MGLSDTARLLRSWYADAMAAGPRYARILAITRRIGPLAGIELEVHYGPEPPFQISTVQIVPRGVEPRVGQDVAVSRSVGDSHTTYVIIWDQEPQYGTRGG
jgi:hypothetical protein